VNAKTWADFLTAVAGPNAPTSNQSEIARVAGVSTATVSRWVSGDSRPKAEQVIGVARAYNVSPLHALVAAGYLEQAEVEGEVEIPRALAIADYTELELAQEMLRRIDRGQGALLQQPVDVDHPAWSVVGGAAQDDIESLPNAAKSDAREVEEDDHTP
jgi:transcriptional regulator with XRE-family HTH domain